MGSYALRICYCPNPLASKLASYYANIICYLFQRPHALPNIKKSRRETICGLGLTSYVCFSYLCTMDLELKSQLQTHVYDVIACCLNVRKVLGPHLNEYMYQEALEMEFQDQNMEYVAIISLP